MFRCVLLDRSVHHELTNISRKSCVCEHGAGVEQQHAAVVRYLADTIQKHTLIKVYLELTVLDMCRTRDNRCEAACVERVVA